MSSHGANGVSFRITRGPPSSTLPSNSRHHAQRRYSSASASSDDDEDRNALERKRRRGDEAITSIDRSGVRFVKFNSIRKPSILTVIKYTSRSSSAPKKEQVFIIPSLPNKDFRRAAIELRAKKEGRTAYIPGQPSAANDGASKSKRNLSEQEKTFLASGSNVQRIGKGIVLGGIKERTSFPKQVGNETPVYEANGQEVVLNHASTPNPSMDGEFSHASLDQLDADALALQELLTTTSDSTPITKVHIIPQAETHITEDDAYRIDVETRPDSATLEDYARVPIDDFGAALLRGMGGGNRPQKPKVEAYIPKARSALLGIGAKSREETFGTAASTSTGNGKGPPKESRRDAMRFVPLQKIERTSGTVKRLTNSSMIGASEGNEQLKDSERRKRRIEDEEFRHRKQERRPDNDGHEESEFARRKRRDKENESAKYLEDSGKHHSTLMRDDYSHYGLGEGEKNRHRHRERERHDSRDLNYRDTDGRKRRSG